MKIVITGIAGFIGMHTALRLKELGHEVMGFDNLNNYYEPLLKKERVACLQEKDIEFQFLDLRDRLRLMDYISTTKPDMVIHLAAMAGVRYSMDHADEYLDTNCHGSLNLITACEANDIQNVIYASTSCVMHGNELPWGEPEYLYPQINPYGYTKAITESQFHISKIPNAVGLRFFTVYGPWGRPDMALFDFTKNILAGKPITLFNNGDMQRDFTYVDDIVQGIGCVVDNMTPRDMYSIGRGEVVELQRFVDAIQDTLGKKAIIEYGPKHPADAKTTASDTTKLQSIGYKPKTSIEEGVNNFVQWYRRHYGE